MWQFVMGLIGLGMGAVGLISGMAPSFVGSVDNVLTPYYDKARQRVRRKRPWLEIDATSAITLRYRGVISREAYYDIMAANGFSKERADRLYKLQEQLPTITELATMVWKGVIELDEAIKKAKQLGYKERDAMDIIASQKSTLTADELTSAYWRGIIDEDTYYTKMREAGYMEEDAEIFEQQARFFPSHEDLIRFQVRDVYNPRIVAKYGYDEEFPERIMDDAKKIGMDKDTMLKYWRAHWELPSPTQGYEMLQRLNPEVLRVLGHKYEKMGLSVSDIVTGLGTLRELLKVADYPKYWRDRLIAISYAPLTRVDLRRIYQLGLIDREELIARLMELGYTKDDAIKLAKFYDTLKVGKPKHPSVKQVLQFYDYGLYDEDEVLDELESFGYSRDDAEKILELEKKRWKLKEWKEKVALLKELYLAGLVSENEIAAELGKHGVPARNIAYILLSFKRAKKRTVKVPPVKDVLVFYRKGLIDEETAKKWIELSGYTSEVAELYLKVHGSEGKAS